MTDQFYNTPKKKLTPKQKSQRQRHNFLLTFFNNEPKFQIRDVNGFVLAKYHNKAANKWEVAIYTEDSWQKAQDYRVKVPADKTKDSPQTTKK